MAYAIKQEKDLSELSLEELRKFDERIENDVVEILSLEGSISAKDHFGGTAPNQVKQAIQAARKTLK